MHHAPCAKLCYTQNLLAILVSNFYMTDLEVHTVAACAYIHVHIGVRLSSLARLYTTSNGFANYYALMSLRSRSKLWNTLLMAKILFQIALLSLHPRRISQVLCIGPGAAGGPSAALALGRRGVIARCFIKSYRMPCR
jgi:hypothetical protein